ncbi:MAG: TonB family protein [Opitutae bacterium]|nr:TonB family protein [Opitutae bacterium]
MHRRFLAPSLVLAAAFVLPAAPARAQEVIVGPLHWYYPEDEGAQLPVVKRPLRVEYPERLKGSDEIYYAILNLNLSSKGKHLIAANAESGSDGLVRAAAMRPYAGVRYAPARRENQDVDAHVWHAVIFNPASTSAKKPDAPARLLEVWPGFLPAPKQAREGLPRPWVKIHIDPEGAARLAAFDDDRDSADAAVAPAARAAVARWKFAPARKDGKPIESEVELPVVMLPVEPPENRSDWPPEVTQQGPPVYPDAMRAARLRGEVTVGFVVNTEGRVTEAAALASNNPLFDEPAIKAVLQWRFKPGRRHGQPVSTRMAVPIVFQLDEPGGGNDLYSVKKGDLAKFPPEWQYDQPPKPINMAFAVYPRTMLERRKSGTVNVTFVVDRGGHVTDISVVGSPPPEFAQAIVAMLDAGLFDPARKRGNPTSTIMRMDQTFSIGGDGDVPVSQATKDLLAELKKKKPVAELKELDAVPKARSRREPVFPYALQGKTDHGAAEVEFFIDTDGTVLLPRAVSASAEEFGYAAVQAVSQWKFEPPLRAGKAVLVRAQIPISFKLRSEAAP